MIHLNRQRKRVVTETQKILREMEGHLQGCDLRERNIVHQPKGSSREGHRKINTPTSLSSSLLPPCMWTSAFCNTKHTQPEPREQQAHWCSWERSASGSTEQSRAGWQKDLKKQRYLERATLFTSFHPLLPFFGIKSSEVHVFNTGNNRSPAPLYCCRVTSFHSNSLLKPKV